MIHPYTERTIKITFYHVKKTLAFVNESHPKKLTFFECFIVYYYLTMPERLSFYIGLFSAELFREAFAQKIFQP